MMKRRHRKMNSKEEMEALEEARDICIYCGSEACTEKGLKLWETEFYERFGKDWKEYLQDVPGY